MRVSYDNEHEEVDSRQRRRDLKNYCLLTDMQGENKDRPVIGAHWHEWLEVIYIEEGNMTVECNGQAIEVKAGQAIAIGVQMLHKIIGDVGRYHAKCLHIHIGFVMQNVNVSRLYEKVVLLSDMDSFRRAFAGIEMEMDQNDSISLMRFQADLLYLLAQIVEEADQVGDTHVERTYSESFSHIADYVAGHYTEEMSLTDLADRFGFTPQYISNLFRKYMDSTFHTYLSKLRMDRAKMLLISSDDNIADIAYSCGFASETSMIEKFKNLYGMTPRRFRKKHVDVQRENEDRDF